MGKRGPKAKIVPQKAVICDYFNKVGLSDSEAIVRPIVRSFLDSVIGSLQEQKVKHHDGANVTDKTLDQWKMAYKWLEIEKL